MSNHVENVLLVGTGPMAVEYYKVLGHLGIRCVVVGRGKTSCQRFESLTGYSPIQGGLSHFCQCNSLEGWCVIIATGTEALMNSLLGVLEAGADKVLIEKPAAISIDELLSNEGQLKRYLYQVFVAYNRRFFASVLEAERLIEEDGGLVSMHFEFTEWAQKIANLNKAPGVKENWFFANSTHVVDLAFFMGGAPLDWKAFAKGGGLDWHRTSVFSGAGVTDKGVLFSYMANWESPGRWGLELLTKRRRIFLKPLEEIWIQSLGELVIRRHSFDGEDDIQFKPGLLKQVSAFLFERANRLLSLGDHLEAAREIYSKVLLLHDER